MNTSYDLSYDLRDDNHNTISRVNMNFENPDDDVLVDQLNTWLTAIKSEVRVTAES